METREPERRKGSVLGVLAYLIVPGERRRSAATHFRRAGMETLKGVGALVRPEGALESAPEDERQRIEIQ
jgi:hypothetical protein